MRLSQNTAIKMDFDEEGVCAGCRYFGKMENEVDWEERKRILEELIAPYGNSNRPYDCLIPVSGGKDSHYQAYMIKEVYGLKPLLMTFNHCVSPYIGMKNMANIIQAFGVDHVRFTPNPRIIKKLMKYTLRKLGDLSWFCQSSVPAVTIQVAVQYKIPLIIWGEHGWSHLFGKNADMALLEFTEEERDKLHMRGLSIEQVLEDNPDIERRDLSFVEYPDQEEIEKIGIKGIYLGNYIKWVQKDHTEFMIKNYGFTTRPKARTYNTYADVDCNLCSGTNDYLKYLKFGYGRTTDHASQDIREGRINREEGIKLVKKYDHLKPEDMKSLLENLKITEVEFMEAVEPFRNPNVWEKKGNGDWIKRISIDPENKIRMDDVDEVIERLNFVKNWKEEELDSDWYL